MIGGKGGGPVEKGVGDNGDEVLVAVREIEVGDGHWLALMSCSMVGLN